MSRSFKKTPGWTDMQGCKVKKWYKRQANRRVRNAPVVPQGGGFKKCYCSWSICDYKFLFFSKQEVLKDSRDSNYPPYKYYIK